MPRTAHLSKWPNWLKSNHYLHKLRFIFNKYIHLFHSVSFLSKFNVIGLTRWWTISTSMHKIPIILILTNNHFQTRVYIAALDKTQLIYKKIKINLNLPPNFIEIEELSPWQMQKLSPLVLSSVSLTFPLHQLQNEGAARADIIAAWQEIAADKRLQHAGFAAALAPHHRHLRQLDRRLASKLREDVLQLIHYRYDRVPQRRRSSSSVARRPRRLLFRHGVGWFR